MSTLFCNACNTENHSNSTKCEQCKSILLHENINSIFQNELENDYLDIDNAEMKGKIIKLENLEEFDEAELGIETTCIEKLVQAIKEEPEFQIEPEFVNEDENVTKKQHVYQCTECSKCFKRKTALYSHTCAIHNKTVSESESSDNSQSVGKKEGTKSIQNASFLKCDLCNDSFANNKELKDHQSNCVKKEKFFCDVCKIYVARKSALYKHNRSKQHNFNRQNPPTGDIETFKFVCLFCYKRFPLQVDLTKHKKTHTEEAKLLTAKSRIERINGRITYICAVCDKSTTNKACHTEHLRVHTKEKPVKCDSCESAFSTRSSLIRHMALHSDDRPYKCNICSETYRHKRNLRKHLFMHTGQRPFECKYCDKTFALRYTFNDHVRLLHTKEAPYQCEECEKSFRTSALLNFHRREAHSIDTNSKPKVKILKKES